MECRLIMMNPVENSIDECAGIFASEFLRNFDRFIDRHLRRNLFEIEQLKNGESKDVAIDRGHPVARPMPCVFFDDLIDFGEMLQNPLHQNFGKALHLRKRFVLAPKRGGNRDAVSRKINLKKELKRQLPGFSSKTHSMILSSVTLAFDINEPSRSPPWPPRPLY